MCLSAKKRKPFLSQHVHEGNGFSVCQCGICVCSGGAGRLLRTKAGNDHSRRAVSFGVSARFIKEPRRVSPPRRRKKVQSFSQATCAAEKILLGLQTCAPSAQGGRRVRCSQAANPFVKKQHFLTVSKNAGAPPRRYFCTFRLPPPPRPARPRAWHRACASAARPDSSRAYRRRAG